MFITEFTAFKLRFTNLLFEVCIFNIKQKPCNILFLLNLQLNGWSN